MSQVSFFAESNGKKFDVLAGWDEPCRWFFLVITDAQSGEQVYSNLDHAEPAWLGRDTALFRKELTDRAIVAPEGFWERVERREGNAVYISHEGAWR